MISCEKLVMLYKSTEINKNREIIYNKIFDNVKKMAYKTCHFYSNILPPSIKKDFFEGAIQESHVCLLNCIEKFNPELNTKFITFYYICLSNCIKTYYENNIKKCINEIPDNSIFDWYNSEIIEETEDKIDFSYLNKILKKNIEQLQYSKEIHKSIFLDYVGFSNDKLNKNFANIGEKYKITRMGIKKICNKYMAMLIKHLEKNGDIEKLKVFL